MPGCLPSVFENWSQFLKFHRRKILIGGASEIIIITAAVLVTYFLTKQPACEIYSGTSSSAIQTSTVSSFTKTSSGSDTSPASTTTASTHASSTTTPGKIPPNNITCAVGFTYINHKCWRLFTDLQTRENADSACMRYGGSTLFSIRNEQENNAMLGFMLNAGVDNLWTGLICVGKTTFSCTWDMESGTTSVYNSFASESPDNTYGSCVYFMVTGTQAGQWKSGLCNMTMSFVCELPPTVLDKNCINNYNNHCYLRYDDSDTVVEAQRFCNTKCANLVSIHSANENRYIQTIYYVDGYIALGAVAPIIDYIIWMDGSPQLYNNIQDNSNGTCVFMRILWGGAGYWYTIDCVKRSWFLCKRTAGIVC